MLQGWRRFGTQDAISQREIRQAGVTDVVTALYHVPCGGLWTVDEIQKRADEIKTAGIRWSVVESVPFFAHLDTEGGPGAIRQHPARTSRYSR